MTREEALQEIATRLYAVSRELVESADTMQKKYSTLSTSLLVMLATEIATLSNKLDAAVKMES